MKLKLLKIAVLFWAIFALVSCENNGLVDQNFDKSPTERINDQKSELNDLLESAEFGWKAVYFTDNTQLGGYTHVFKFKNGKVDMASDFDDDTSVKTSDYSIELSSTVSLLFSTKNRIHLLSDSNSYPTATLKGKGYLGDFQFLYYGQENGQIIFRTNRSFQELRFTKATAQDWSNLALARAMIPNVTGNTSSPLFRSLELKNGTNTQVFDFSFTPETRFAQAKSIDDALSPDINIGIAYTATGISVSPAIKVGDTQITDFVFDPVTGNFNSVSPAGNSATIKFSYTPLILTNDYLSLREGVGNTLMAFGYISPFLTTAPTNSLLARTLLDGVNASLATTQSISRVQFVFNDSTLGSYIQYRFNGGKTTIYHFVTITEDATNKTIILKHKYWTDSTGQNIPEPTYLKNIDVQLLDPKGLYVKKESFKITYSNTIFTFTTASSNFRLTTYAF